VTRTGVCAQNPDNERNGDVPSIGTETDQILACRQTKHNVVYRLAKFPQKQNLVNLGGAGGASGFNMSGLTE